MYCSILLDFGPPWASFMPQMFNCWTVAETIAGYISNHEHRIRGVSILMMWCERAKPNQWCRIKHAQRASWVYSGTHWLLLPLGKKLISRHLPDIFRFWKRLWLPARALLQLAATLDVRAGVSDPVQEWVIARATTAEFTVPRFLAPTCIDLPSLQTDGAHRDEPEKKEACVAVSQKACSWTARC